MAVHISQHVDFTLLYSLERAIKTYRQFAQRNISANDLDITIDQWLVLKTIHDFPELNQKEIAERVFKDYASITRIIEILVKKEFLERFFHYQDRRRYRLELTNAGKEMYKALTGIVELNRSEALRGFNDREKDMFTALSDRIYINCKNS
jgi:DNA-binding MarR family transcriptional regulator